MNNQPQRPRTASAELKQRLSADRTYRNLSRGQIVSILLIPLGYLIMLLSPSGGLVIGSQMVTAGISLVILLGLARLFAKGNVQRDMIIDLLSRRR